MSYNYQDIARSSAAFLPYSALPFGVGYGVTSTLIGKLSKDRFQNFMETGINHAGKFVLASIAVLFIPLGVQRASSLVKTAATVTAFALSGCLWAAKNTVLKGREDIDRLSFEEMDLAKANLELVPTHVKKVYLYRCQNIESHLQRLPKHVETVQFWQIDLQEVDPSKIAPTVKTLEFYECGNTLAHFRLEQVREQIAKLDFSYCNLQGVNLNQIPRTVTEVDLRSAQNFDRAQIPEGIAVIMSD